MKKLLAISPEAILPPKSGGSLRSTNLLVGLSKRLEVSVLIPQDKRSISKSLEDNSDLLGPHWIGITDLSAYIRLSSLDRFCVYYLRWRENRLRYNWRHLPWHWFFGSHHSWKLYLRKLSQSYTPDFFLVEHTRNAAIFSYAKQLWPNVICICDSHNVESNLLLQVLPDTPKKNASVRRIQKYERSIIKQCDVFWACSHDDLRHYQLIQQLPKISAVIPNGVKTDQIPFLRSTIFNPLLLFIGNLGYEPNIEGVLWFFRQVWPELKTLWPNLQWQLVGSWADQSILELDGDDIHVAVDVVSVLPYLEQASVAICPLFSGSGTRLKILEAFSAGVPVVATSRGAEGIEVIDGHHLLLANSAYEFGNAVHQLLSSAELCETLRAEARLLVEHNYDWDVITNHASDLLLSFK